MTWTYSGDPSDSNRDAVRFIVGDTDSDDQLLTNEEIDWLLAQNGSKVYTTAAVAARTVASKFSRMADKSVGDLSLKASQKARAYLKLAEELDDLSTSSVAAPSPYAGGISESDMDSVEEDTDRTKPSFAVGMHDYETNQYFDPKIDRGK